LFDRYNVDPASALFIDDNVKNIDAGNKIGLTTIHFTSAEQLGKELQKLGILEGELR
jgi:2-haloacid dehalogenase